MDRGDVLPSCATCACGSPSRCPVISAFPEINVRTYVTLNDKPGIYLFSLDAGSRPAVEAARRLTDCPPSARGMSMRAQSRDACFDTERTGPQPDAPPARFQADYRPRKLFQASPGTLEHWLTKRHCP